MKFPYVDENGIQVAVYPSKYVNITQVPNGGYSHALRQAVDEAGKDTVIDDFFAPFDAEIEYVETKSNKTGVQITNTVPAKGSNGKIHAPYSLHHYTYHDNDISDLWVGKKLKQGEVYYQEGTAGHASGNHVHFNVGKGTYVKGTYPLVQNSAGNWEVKNEISPMDLFYLTEEHIVKSKKGLSFKTFIQPERNISVVSTVYSGVWGKDFTLSLQKYFGTYEDGIMSGQRFPISNVAILSRGTSGSELVKALQKWCGASVDGQLGPKTILAMQKKMGVYADGRISPVSSLVKAMRKAIAEGTMPK